MIADIVNFVCDAFNREHDAVTNESGRKYNIRKTIGKREGVIKCRIVVKRDETTTDRKLRSDRRKEKGERSKDKG
jgi:hypothetical protein